MLDLITLIKIIKGLISRNKWKYFLKICSDCYYLKIASEKSFTLIKVDERQLVWKENIEIELPMDFISFLAESKIKVNTGGIVHFTDNQISVNDLTFQYIPAKVDVIEVDEPEHPELHLSKYILDRATFIYGNKYFNEIYLWSNNFISFDKDYTICSFLPTWTFHEEEHSILDVQLFVSSFLRFLKEEGHKVFHRNKEYLFYTHESKTLNFQVIYPIHKTNTLNHKVFDKVNELIKGNNKIVLEKDKIQEWNRILEEKKLERISIKKIDLVLDSSTFRGTLARLADYEDHYEKIHCYFKERHGYIKHNFPQQDIVFSKLAKPENLNLSGINSILFGEEL